MKIPPKIWPVIAAVLVVAAVFVGYASGIGRSSAKNKTFAEAKALMVNADFRFQGYPTPIPKSDRTGWPQVILKHCDVMFYGLAPGSKPVGQIFGFVCDSHGNAEAARTALLRFPAWHGADSRVSANVNLLFAIAAKDRATADRWSSQLGAS